MKLFLLFSHSLVKEQIEDAKISLNVDEFINLPNDLQAKFSQIPADFNEKELIKYAQPFFKYLNKNAEKGDFVLVQGDFGLVFLLVNFCLDKGFVPIYATTKRDVIVDKDGLKTSIFKHVRFRKYGV